MSEMVQTGSWLAKLKLPEALSDDIRLLRDLMVAEEDVQKGRVRTLPEAKELVEQKLALRRSRFV